MNKRTSVAYPKTKKWKEGSLDMSNIFNEVVRYAEEHYNGHFTLLKFTSYWRFCFGTLEIASPFINDLMAKGDTMEEAMLKGLNDKIDCYKIEKELWD